MFGCMIIVTEFISIQEASTEQMLLTEVLTRGDKSDMFSVFEMLFI